MGRVAPTKDEKQWMNAISRIGCVACHLKLGQYRPTQVHHITSRGRRLGHGVSIPLCPWHHQGYAGNGMTSQQMRAFYGPSLAESKRDFVAEFGTELDLLEKVKEMVQ